MEIPKTYRPYEIGQIDKIGGYEAKFVGVVGQRDDEFGDDIYYTYLFIYTEIPLFGIHSEISGRVMEDGRWVENIFYLTPYASIESVKEDYPFGDSAEEIYAKI